MADRRLPVVQPDRPTPPTPVFEKIAIAGLGLIGGSLALAARKTWPTCLVIGLDEKDVLEAAMVRHAIDVAADDAVVMAEADLVVLAAPVCTNMELLDAVAEHVRTPAVVTDVGGSKRAMVERATRLPTRFQFVGGHPLAGAARAGIEHARPDLFEGRPWILTPAGDGGGRPLERVSAFVSALGAVPHVMEPAAHDRAVGYVNHLPHVVAAALMHVVGEGGGDEGLSLAGRGLIDTTRLASAPGDVWADVCRTNDDTIAGGLDELIAVLSELRAGLDSEEAIARVFDSANRWRARLTGSRSS